MINILLVIAEEMSVKPEKSAYIHMGLWVYECAHFYLHNGVGKEIEDLLLYTLP